MPRMTTMWATLATLWLALLVASSACSPTPATPAGGATASPGRPAEAPTATGPRKAIKIGSLVTIGLAPILVAQQRGYFDQEGLAVEVVNFSNGSEVVPALAQGQIDAAASISPSAGLVNAVSRGLGVRMVASNGTIEPHRNIANIIVRKDLAPASGYLDLATLKPPIRAAATVDGILPHAVLLLEAERAGFRLSDVSMTFLALPDINAALKGGQLDIAASGEPLITLAEQQGIAVRWKEMATDFPDMPYSNVLYGPTLLSQDRDAGVRLMRAYLRGVRDYEDAFARGKDRDAIVGILAGPLQTPPALFDAVQQGGGLAYIDPDGRVPTEPLRPIIDLWVRTQLVQAGFDPTQLVDPAFATDAVATLGAYR
jgi:NitT/TauT family transport system substrate-binding protein